MHFDKTFSDLIAARTEELRSQYLEEVLVRKAAKRGINVTKADRVAFVRWILAGGKEPYSTESEGHCEISVTRRDLRRLLGRLGKRIEQDIASGMQAVIRAGPGLLRPDYDRTWPAEQRRQQRAVMEFRKRLALRYEKAFGLFAMLQTIARELGDLINHDLRQQPMKGARGALVEALTRLHARACQISCEVEVLLLAGYADGAMARWRSLHETSVTLQFIVKHGAATAVRYLDHEHVGVVFAAQKYNKAAAQLNQVPYSAGELAAMEATAQTIIRKHGDAFAGEFGWAARDLGFIKPRGLRFEHIEAAVGLAHLHPYYKWASQYVHAGPKSLTNRLGMPDSPHILLTGSSNRGLTDPAHNTALSIMHATVALVTIASSIDRLCYARVASDLAAEIGAEFLKVEHEIEAEEKEKVGAME